MARNSIVSRLIRYPVTFYLRLALGVDFLSAVADRFGLWGPAGSGHVAWGNFSNFVAYTAKVDVFTPAGAVRLVAWIVTIAEIVLGVCLILGIFTRVSAILSGTLLALFALGMSLGTGPKSAFDASVFAASAGAFALAALGPHGWSIDSRMRRRKAAPLPPLGSPPPPDSAEGETERPSDGED